MKSLVKQFLNHDISRRSFTQSLMALGLSSAAAQSILASAAAADTVFPDEGLEVTGSGGDILAETLRAAGVEYIFNVSSTGMSPFFDALAVREDIKLIQALQEGQGTSMAQGYELASGKTAVLMVPGIGMPNAMNNLYNAWKDRSSILLLTDGNNTELQGRDMFQQMDDWMSPMDEFSKWSWRVANPNRIGEFVRKAYKVAATPPGGPVYIRIPGNVMGTKELTQTIFPQSRFTVPMDIQPKPELIEEAAKLLIEAQNPAISVGSEVTRAGATDDLIELAELTGITVAQGYSVYGDFPFDHPLFAGYYAMGLPSVPRDMDVFLNLGGHMPDPGIFTRPVGPTTKVIHARIEYENIADIYPTDVAIAAGLKETITSLTDAIKSMATAERLKTIADERIEVATAKFEDGKAKRIKGAQSKWDNSPITTARLGAELDNAFDKDAIVIGEAGDRITYQWLGVSPKGRQLIGQTTGYALGWGVGTAMGAKIAKPDQQVVALVGDGAMLFGQLESLWTAARYSIPIIVVIFNNRSYDGERNRIYLASPLARSGQKELWKDMTCFLGNPDIDYVGIAKSFEIEGGRANEPSELASVLQRAVDVTREGRPFLVDVNLAQRGLAADVNWHPDISIADLRTRKV